MSLIVATNAAEKVVFFQGGTFFFIAIIQAILRKLSWCGPTIFFLSGDPLWGGAPE